MSEMTTAFSELYAAQTEAIGTAQTVTIGATSGIGAIIEAVPRDLVLIDGGVGEGQIFKIQILASALSNVEPAKYTAISFTPVGGSAFSGAVLSVDTNNGIFIITAGDPNANE
jgi:hypothetical protein